MTEELHLKFECMDCIEFTHILYGVTPTRTLKWIDAALNVEVTLTRFQFDVVVDSEHIRFQECLHMWFLEPSHSVLGIREADR